MILNGFIFIIELNAIFYTIPDLNVKKNVKREIINKISILNNNVNLN